VPHYKNEKEANKDPMNFIPRFPCLKRKNPVNFSNADTDVDHFKTKDQLCAAPGCPNRKSYILEHSIGFYKFPRVPWRRREQWISFVQKEDDFHFDINKEFLCGNHFQQEDKLNRKGNIKCFHVILNTKFRIVSLHSKSDNIGACINIKYKYR
jgi:hypothetical protein